ncbi:MAG: hypothetical protein JXM71_08235 [Spirochaetales bacterium]|nr:hypothetical protein [Spirochaetales bacterium]
MVIKSLLRRAAEFRKAAGSELSGAGDFTFDKSSGISSEDQRDILRHIDQVAKSSRILAGPDTWKVKPRKRGILLPLAVNMVGFLVLAGGLFGLGHIFSQQDQGAANDTVMLESAEGRLLQEIKREAEGRLQEKDKEIASIQERMASLDRERADLLTSVESRIKAKEVELREALNIELERERQRLIAEGLSESAIQERLKEFERRKSEEFASQLSEFTRKAEEERLAMQANLDKARDEFRENLSVATAERQRIQDESRAREQELRAQLTEKDQALETERARTAETLRTAQAELTRLNEDAARMKAAEDQLLGLYASARQALRDGRLDDAMNTLTALRGYLEDPRVATIPSLMARRELDLFAADLIEKTINTERAKATVDTSKLSAALDAVSVINSETARARQAAAAGDNEAAAQAYRRALGATKELEEAGTFLEESWRARFETQAAQAEAALAAAAKIKTDTTEALSAMEANVSNTIALRAAFDRLLVNLPLGPGQATAVYGYITSAGARDAEAAKRAADTNAAEAPARAAASALASGRFLEALRGYSSVLTDYPAAGQAPRVADGIVAAAAGLDAALREARERAAERVAELEAAIEVAESDAATLRERVATLEAAGTTPATPVAEAGAPTSAEYVALQEEKTRVEAQLVEARARYEAVSAAYRAYAADEDALLSGGGDLAMVEARSRLDAFLDSPEVSAAMPGMRERIARYLSSFQTAGQSEILFNAADILDGAARIRDEAVRERYFTDLEARYAGDESMLEFLSVVKQSLR